MTLQETFNQLDRIDRMVIRIGYVVLRQNMMQSRREARINCHAAMIMRQRRTMEMLLYP